jgi:hypothetical protein
MQVELKSAKFEIIFQHNPKLKASSCVVMRNGNIVGTALIGEQTKACFSKDCSRKKALTQAIKRLPVGERFELWDHYRTMTASPRWPMQKLTSDLKAKLLIRESNRLAREEAFRKARLARKQPVKIQDTLKRTFMGIPKTTVRTPTKKVVYRTDLTVGERKKMKALSKTSS